MVLTHPVNPDISPQGTLRTRSWFVLKKLRPKPENANYNILLLAISTVFYISHFKPQISAVSATSAVGNGRPACLLQRQSLRLRPTRFPEEPKIK